MAFSKKSDIADMVSEKRMTFFSYTLTEILRCFSFLLNHWGGDVETDRGGGWGSLLLWRALFSVVIIDYVDTAMLP